MIEISEKNVDEVFRYHSPTEDQIPRFLAINEAAKALAVAILENVPRCPLRTRALNNVMDTRMAANAAIALEKVE